MRARLDGIYKAHRLKDSLELLAILAVN